MERRWAIVLVVVAAVMTVVLAVMPMARTEACLSSSAGPPRCTSHATSLLDHEGGSVLGLLAVPLLMAGAAVAARTRRVRMAIAGALTAFALLAIMTIGPFLLPVVALAWGLAYSTSASSAAK